MDATSEVPVSAPPKPERWGPWTTLAWVAGALMVTLIVQVFTLFAFLHWWNGAHPGNPLGLRALNTNGPAIVILTVVSTPFLVGVLAWAAWLSRIPVRDYLALAWPSARELLIGLAALIVLVPLGDIVTQVSGHHAAPFMTDTFDTARQAGMLPMLVLAFVVMAPLGEEITFRGFFFRGFLRKTGPVFTILITAAAWAALHVQYDFFFVSQVFVLGLVFGWLRWRSGSTMLTILLHALNNGYAVLELFLLSHGH